MSSFIQKDVYIVAFPFYLIGCFITFIFWVLLIFQSFVKVPVNLTKINKQLNFYRITTSTCFTSGLLCIVIDTARMYICYKKNYYMLQDQLYEIKIVADAFFFCCSTSLNIILFGRVFFTFQNSYFRLSKLTVLAFIVQIATSIILALSFVCIIIYFEDDTAGDAPTSAVLIALICNDLILSISLLCLFAYKLSNTVINAAVIDREHTQYITHEQSLNLRAKNVQVETDLVESLLSVATNESMVRFTDIQLKFIVVITRHTILSAFAIFFNQFYYEIGLFSMIYWNKMGDSYFYGTLVYGLRCVSIVGIVVSLYLSLKFGRYSYFKCCRVCHLACYTICIKCTKNRQAKIGIHSRS
eukprot:284844_1